MIRHRLRETGFFDVPEGTDRSGSRYSCRLLDRWGGARVHGATIFVSPVESYFSFGESPLRFGRFPNSDRLLAFVRRQGRRHNENSAVYYRLEPECLEEVLEIMGVV